MYLQSALLLAVLPENIKLHNYYNISGLCTVQSLIFSLFKEITQRDHHRLRKQSYIYCSRDFIFWSKKMILDKINRILVNVFATKIDMGYWYNRLKYFDIYSILPYIAIYEHRRSNTCI